MALFGSDDEEPETEEVDPPEAEPPEEPARGEDDPAPDEEASQSPQDEDPADETSSAEGEEDLDVEEALKELSARMAMLSSNLEGVQESRTELEDKLGSVEQRMSRLGSLAEAVSSEYNPFVSENAPNEPSWTPKLEADEAGDAPGPDPGPGEGPDAATGSPDGRPAEEDAPAGKTPAPEAAKATAEVDPAPEDDASGASTAPDEAGDPEPDALDPAPASKPPQVDGVDGAGTDGHGETPEIPDTSPGRLEAAEAEEIDDVDPEPARNPFPDQRSSSTPSMPEHDGDGELEENMLLLEWVGMMLDRVGRAGLMDLLDYYQNLGWLDPQTKEQATRVAIGVDAPDRVEDHWRGDVELHRRSLVAIQRLQGNEVPAARIDELQLDLQRLFEE